MSLPTDWAPRRSEDCAWNEIDGELVIVSSGRGTISALNGVGAEVWAMCEGRTTLPEIVADICERFEASREVAEPDVMAFLEAMLAQGLIQAPPG